MSIFTSILEWFFNESIPLSDTQSVMLREVVGVSLGLTSAYLGMKRRVAAWPVGIIADGLLVTVFLGAIFSFGDQSQHANFYGQASRNILLIIVSIYGWYRWASHKKAGKDVPAVVPRWTSKKERLILIPVIVAFFAISYQIFKALGESGQWLFVDTWIFTGTALATFGMSRGYVEFWLAWIAVDLVGVPFAFSNGYYPTGTLYAIYLPFVTWGFFNWLRISRSEKE
jgi:nicotinamide mononucleotide transporter